MTNKGPVIAVGILLLLIAIGAGGYFFSRQYFSPTTETPQGTYSPNVTPDAQSQLYTLNNNGYYDENIIEYDPVGGLSIPGTITRVNSDGSFELESSDSRSNNKFTVSFSSGIPVVLVMFADKSDYPPSTSIWEAIEIQNIDDQIVTGRQAILIKDNIDEEEAIQLLENQSNLSINKMIIFNQ